MNVLHIDTQVSIPFKREGISEPESFLPGAEEQGFQFPSNGKVFPNLGDRTLSLIIRSGVFQFPSNGKVFPNMLRNTNRSETILLSFNSLQTGRYFRTECLSFEIPTETESFQFPSNGKVFPNGETYET